MNQKMKILELLPTQFCLGFFEVDFKVKKLEKMIKDPVEFDKYMLIKVVPIILGPNNKKYLIDHHHHVKSLLLSKIDWVYITIMADYSYLSVSEFEKKMTDKKYLNLYDQNGKVKKFSELPKNMNKLTHDFYRSLAWAVREQDGFKKVDEIPFFEFRWGTFYRQYINKQLLQDDFELATSFALKLSKSLLASNLPGFLGKKS